jgi:hypothetical protein
LSTRTPGPAPRKSDEPARNCAPGRFSASDRPEECWFASSACCAGLARGHWPVARHTYLGTQCSTVRCKASAKAPLRQNPLHVSQAVCSATGGTLAAPRISHSLVGVFQSAACPVARTPLATAAPHQDSTVLTIRAPINHCRYPCRRTCSRAGPDSAERSARQVIEQRANSRPSRSPRMRRRRSAGSVPRVSVTKPHGP